MKVTVKEHLMRFLDYYYSNKRIFKTHEIQNLSERGLSKFGKRLGSPETYTRQFRTLKENGDYLVRKVPGKGNEQSWIVIGRLKNV
tara:strand:+ start:2022 stop:2279 length:258 start_codon:yes stop_codon:yes gene_type:complete